MVIVMEISTGKTEKLSSAEAAAAEFGQFVDEVLNAGWLPQPVARLETHEHFVEKTAPAEDTEEFLRSLYRNQE